MTPSELRGLARRVATEPPSQRLEDDVLAAFGWKYTGHGIWVRSTPSGDDPRKWVMLPDPLHSIDAAASMLPAAWQEKVINAGDVFTGIASCDSGNGHLVTSAAPTEARCRTALALFAMAVEKEIVG